MDNSWNNHFQPGQQAGQIRFFDPSQFQPPVSNPATLKNNNVAAQVSPGSANSAFQPPAEQQHLPQQQQHSPQQQQHSPQQQQHSPQQQQPQAWGGPAGNASGAMQDAHNSWASWGSWDWNKDPNNANPNANPNEQPQDLQHQQHYQPQPAYQPQDPQNYQPQAYSADTSQAPTLMTPQYQDHMAGSDAPPDGYNVHQYNNTVWNASGQYVEPNQNFPGNQDLQYGQPQNAAYFGDQNSSYDSNQFPGQPNSMGQYPSPDQQYQQPPLVNNENCDHQDSFSNLQNNSASLDQGQSQLLYDQPSLSQHGFDAPDSSASWYGNAPHPHHPNQNLGQESGVVGENAGSAGLNVDQLNEFPPVASGSPNPTSQNTQNVPPVLAEPSLNEYYDNDNDGGTVAGFFGRGDDDGDVSSDAQRSNRLNPNPMAASDVNDNSQFLNVGKTVMRENSEISNASLSTFNMSVDDEGKEHLHDLQALVQRMENVDIANRQAAEAKQQPGAAAVESVSVDQQQQQAFGDYSGFGNDPPKHNPPPPPSLSLDTNPERPSSPDGGIIPASSESGGSGGSGGSSGLTDWVMVSSQSQMTHSRNSSLDNSITVFSDRPDGSINESQRDIQDGGTNDNPHHVQSSQSFSNATNTDVISFQNIQVAHSSPHSQYTDNTNNTTENIPTSPEHIPQASENVSASSNSALPPPPSSTVFNPPSLSSNVSQPASSEGIPFQHTKTLPMGSPPKSNPTNPPPNFALSSIPKEESTSAPSNPGQDSRNSKPTPPQSSRPKKASEDGARPSNRRDMSQRSAVPDQKFRRPRDPPKKESEDVSLSSQRRHQSAFHPVHRPRQNTVSPATTLWETDSGSSSNILLAPAMPLIIPALNPYSSSAAATATTDTTTQAAKASKNTSTVPDKSKGGAPKDMDEETPRSRYGDRKGDRGKEERQRDREDANRSLDSLDELDSSSDYRSPREEKTFRSERPGSRSERYNYDRPISRSERPPSRSERPPSRNERPPSRTEGYKDDQYRRQKGGYYADSYYDEHYDRPRSRHEDPRNSRPSSRSANEVDRPRSRADYDRDRDYGYKDRERHRGYNYDGYNRNGDYYDERDRYYRYYQRDRDARYSRGYYDEYYGSKNADYYLQQQKQQQQQQPQQQQDRAGSRSNDRLAPGSRNQSASRSESSNQNRSRGNTPSIVIDRSRGNTPGAELSADYYNRGSRPQSRQDYGRDYYGRGYGGYDYAAYYEGYGYYPYGYGYPGYEDSYNQGHEKGRMTPPKYSYAHVRACFGPKGQLVRVLPNNPTDGQPAVTELLDVQSVLETCQEADDLKRFPGPLSREGTHKKDVLVFCQQKARECTEDVDMLDRESAQLIWKLLELLIKQNGAVVGTDLSDLLLEGHEPGVSQYNVAAGRVSRQSNDGLDSLPEDSLEGDGSSRNSPIPVRTSMDRTLITPSRQREDSIARFRHLLLYGRKKDAIECAMKYNLWGHALFLASKMDTRTHASVMIRFANSAMRMNDPLQTLYQMMSGRQPASVTCVVDERWGDWRPHLAMILSNQTSRQDLDRKSITTLGDTLATKGCLHASHFCYLMAQVPFGTYDKKTSKIVLVGSNHLLPLKEFATMDGIQCTEVYEYAQTLNNAAFCLTHFQLYKYLYACRLVDYGMAPEALMYCEVIASAICRYPAYFQPSFAHLVFDLASKLKYADPQRQNSHVDENQDPVWMQQLMALLTQYDDGSIQPAAGTLTPSDMTVSGDVGAALQPPQASSSSTDANAAGSYQGMGEIPVQSSGSIGFEVQGVKQQQSYGDYGRGQDQYQATDSMATATTTTNSTLDPQQQQQQQDQQHQQQYPGYDQTDAGFQHQQLYQDSYNPQAVQQQPYDQQQMQQQQQDYSHWQQQQQQQQQQQYAGYQYTGFDLDMLQQQQQHSQQPQQVDSLTPSPFSSASVSSVVPASAPASATPALQSSWDQESVVEDTGHQTDFTSSLTGSDFSSAGLGMSGGSNMALPPRASISTNETEDDDDDDDDEPDDPEGGGTMTGFDYFGNPGVQKVVAPPHRYRNSSESSSTGTARRRRTISGSSTGSVKASPRKPAPNTAPSALSKPSIGNEGDGKAGSSWLGGLFSKFGRKGKNEMILPDDKDPAIVWDSSKNKWMNADGTEDEVTMAAPPPKDIELMTGSSSSTGGPPPSGPPMALPPSASGPAGANKFSLKAKGVRNQYVDVNNPKPVSAPQGLFNVGPPMGTAASTSPMPQVLLPGTSTSSTNDQSTSGNMLTVPTASSTGNDLSRSSSLSSVNQEVQRLTGQITPDPPSVPNNNHLQQPPPPSSTSQPPATSAPGMPMLFNPSSFKTGASASHGPAGPGLKYGQRRAYPKK